MAHFRGRHRLAFARKGRPVRGIATVQTGTYRTTRHAQLKALAIFFQAHGLPASATRLVCAISAQRVNRASFEFRVKSIRVSLQNTFNGIHAEV